MTTITTITTTINILMNIILIVTYGFLFFVRIILNVHVLTYTFYVLASKK